MKQLLFEPNVKELQRRRLERGLTYEEIARAVGMSRQNIYLVFTGKNRAAKTVNAVASILGLSAQDTWIETT